MFSKGNLVLKQKELYVKKLRAKKIGIKNPRTQQLPALEEDKRVFVNFYNAIHAALKLRNYRETLKVFSFPESLLIVTLSRNCGALSADGLRMEAFNIPNTMSNEWKQFALLIQRLTSKESPVERRRFRRIISPKRMLRLSEMLYAFTSEEHYNNFRL